MQQGRGDFHQFSRRLLNLDRQGSTRPMKIFALRRGDNEPVGVIYYSWPPPNCSGRRKAFGRNLLFGEINKKLATISRVVLHPKYRSMGLGVRLVRETLPVVGRPYVEAIAVMAKYNPFFEKAGMKKIMVRRPGKSIVTAVEKLQNLEFRPYLMASSRSNLEHLKTLSGEDLEKTKEILCSVGYHKRLQSSSKPYVKRSEFREWIGRKSLRTVAKVISRLAVLAEPKAYLLWEKLASLESSGRRCLS